MLACLNSKQPRKIRCLSPRQRADLIAVQNNNENVSLWGKCRARYKTLEFPKLRFFKSDTNALHVQHLPGLLYIIPWNLGVKGNRCKYETQRTSLVSQWLRLCVPNARGHRFDRSHALQSNQPPERGVHPRCHGSPNVNRPAISQSASELSATGLPCPPWDCL